MGNCIAGLLQWASGISIDCHCLMFDDLFAMDCMFVGKISTIQKLKLNGTKISDGVVFSPYSSVKVSANELSIFSEENTVDL